MTMSSESDLAVVAPPAAGTEHHSYVDWPAIIGGIVLASGISLVLLTFGSAIGLSFTDFRAGDDVDPLWIGIAAASWLLWVQISSFMAGAYLTGRLRHRHYDATEHESDVRDGAHGLLVWGGALIVGALIAANGIGAAASAVGSAAGTLTNAVSNVAGGAAGGAAEADPNATFVDTLFRPAPGGAPAPQAAPAAPGTPAPAAAAPAGASSDLRAETGRIFAAATDADGVSQADRDYLAQQVAATTGLNQQDATARVDQVVTAMNDARTKAADAAEAARKTSVVAAFLIAASLLVSAAGAFWAAQKGGRHRDKGTVFADVFRHY